MEETMMESLETTHVSLPPLHWNLSSNVLCNYMKEQSYLDLILKNRAIIPRYVIEPVKYLAIDGLDQICFPMTCFCDIPFSKSFCSQCLVMVSMALDWIRKLYCKKISCPTSPLYEP
mgnify:CR=1 FL=1